MSKENKNTFEILNKIDVSKKIEKKKDLSYLSWAWAWSELMKVCPEAIYKVTKYNDLPYIYDEKTGFMVETNVTIGGVAREMWLPVMNGVGKALKDKPYTYKTKYGNKEVEAATMFDINKAIMRCLVKNIAMFGLGLSIYAGEDLPEEGSSEEQKYKELTTRLEVAILNIKDVSMVNIYFSDILGRHTVVKNSDILEKNLFYKRTKELGLVYDKDKKEFAKNPPLTDEERKEIEQGDK